MDFKELGQRIRKYREQKGISQESFALSIGMDRTYYSAVENGKHNITINNLKKICDGLNVTLSKMLENL